MLTAAGTTWRVISKETPDKNRPNGSRKWIAGGVSSISPIDEDGDRFGLSPHTSPLLCQVDREEKVIMNQAKTVQQLRDLLPTIIDDELPPELRTRVRWLLHDLATNDISVTLLDLVELSRTFTMGTPSENARAPTAGEGSMMPILIYGKDNKTVTERCNGPDSSGDCPQASPTCPVACTGRWIMASGWRFKIAADAESCPVLALGLSRPPTLAKNSSPAGYSLMTTPEDVFVSEAGLIGPYFPLL
jgi:hypothetical protein